MATPRSNIEPVPLPPNMTKVQIKELQEKYHSLAAEGRTSDPEFLRVAGILKTIHQRFQKQIAERNRQAQAAGMQANGASPTAPSPGAAAAGVGQQQNGPNSGINVAKGPNGLANGGPQQQQSQAAANGGMFTTNSSLNFTPEQLEILKHQVFAFKRLGKQLSVPADSLNIIFKPRVNSMAAPSPMNGTPSQGQAPPSSLDGVADGKFAEDRPKPAASTSDASSTFGHAPFHYTGYKSPYKYPIDLSAGVLYTKHSDRSHRQMLTSLIPPSIDFERVYYEREAIIYNRMMQKIEALREKGAGEAYWDFSKSDKPVANTNIDKKHRIQLLKLQLLQKQRLLRQSISMEVMYADNLAQTANRSLHRKRKRVTTATDARITEKLEKAQRDQRETKERTKQREQLDAIITHARELRENAAERKMRHSRAGKLMLQCQQNIEKEEQKRIERTAKQRLQALKNDDEATYLKLLGQAKDSRISHLLQQTDGFLGQLATSVKQQQRSARERYGGGMETAESSESEESEVEEDEDGNPKIDYYEVAHRIKEEVKTQPNILVGGTLKEYQVKGLQWMISLFNNNLNGILADEMGLGKTIQTISLLTHLVERKQNPGPFLVIVPLSTLTNWNLEFERWAPSLVKIVYKGTPQQRRPLQQLIRQANFQVLLTTYEYIIKDRPVLSKIKWVHMIIDEGHRMKNTQSKLSSTLTQYYHSRYRLILTGTPLQNNLPELWALLNFVLPNIFKSVKSFDEWFNTPFANTGGQDKMELTEEEQLLIIRRLHKVLRPFLLRRLKKDVEKDLPDKQERVIKCKFSQLQTRLYKQLVTSNKLNVSDGKGGKTSMRGLSNMLMQLRKLCNHPFVFEQVEDEVNPNRETNDMIWRTAGKFELLDRVLPKFKATGHRVLLFFQMTQIMNIMEDFLRLRGMHYLRLDGSTKSEDRSDLLRKFNAPDSPYFCFLLSTRAGGLGLNLQTADTVIIYDSDWNPFQDLQAQDRAHRIGQKNEVRILRLISSNSVEEKILERARFKLNMDTKVIQAGKFDNKTSVEERETLLRALLDSAEAADALNEQEEMDDDDLNQTMARTDDELKLFQEMDEARNKDPVYGIGKKPRLVQDDEVPDLYLQDEVAAPDVVEEFAGRGARERTRVRYDDGLTEEQWAMAVDADDDDIESAIARKQARIDKRQANKEKRTKNGGEIESSPSRHSSEEPPPPPPPPTTTGKKRGRKSGAAKRKLEEEHEAPTPSKPPAKRGRQSKILDTLTPKRRDEIQKIMDTAYDYVLDLSEEFTNEEDGSTEKRELIGPFMKLVPKNMYPDYYMLITNPISMDMIGKRINKNEYQNLNEFVRDVQLLADNARLYNEDGSWLHQDATKVEAAIMDKLRETTQAMPEWRDWENNGGLPGPASSGGDASGTATPKLKLKFGGSAASKEPAASSSTPAAESQANGDGSDNEEE